MKKGIKRGLIVVAVALLIAIVTAVSINTKESSGPFTRVMSAVTRPFRAVMTKAASAFESIYGYMYQYDELKSENEKLRAQVAELEQNKAEYTEMSRENERLRELVGLPARFTDYNIDTAVIMSWGASNWESTFTVSKGSGNSAIEAGDGVITSSGALIGQVIEVYENTSLCRSVIDTSFSAGVTVGSSVDSKAAKGDFSLMRKGMLALTLLEEGSAVVSGDPVVTSGKGGVFPKGLVVGYVDDVFANAGGTGRSASVRPSVELSTVTDVFVITDFEVSE